MRESDGNKIFSSDVFTFGYQNLQAEMAELLRRVSVKPNVIDELSKPPLGWVDGSESMLLWPERVDFSINRTDDYFHRRLQILQMKTKIMITQCLARCLDPLGRCLSFLGLFKSGIVVFEQSISSILDVFSHQACFDICDGDQPISGSRFVCSICPDIDLVRTVYPSISMLVLYQDIMNTEPQKPKPGWGMVESKICQRSRLNKFRLVEKSDTKYRMSNSS